MTLHLGGQEFEPHVGWKEGREGGKKEKEREGKGKGRGKERKKQGKREVIIKSLQFEPH